MNKEQILYLLRENESLKLKMDRLEQSTERLQSRYYDAENQLTNFKNKYDFLKGQFKEVARQCFPRDYIELKLGTASEKDVYDFLVSKIRDLEVGFFSTSQENIKKLEEIAELKDEMERYRSIGKPSSEGVSPQGTSEEKVTPELGQNAASAMKPQPMDNLLNPVLGMVSSLSEREWLLLEIVGKGETLFSDIVSQSKLANSVVSDIFSSLQEKGLTSFERVAKGGKGRPAHHYFLTPLGAKVFEVKYKTIPVTTMLEKLSTHGSIVHGGLMLEVGEFLEENGCDVFYDGRDTSFKLRDGREIRFDIKAIDRETKEIHVFETERSKCGDQHLKEKIQKCWEFSKLRVTKTVNIVASDKTALHQIQQQIFRWVRENDTIQMLQTPQKDRAQIIFRIASVEDFKNGKLQEFYYGVK